MKTLNVVAAIIKKDNKILATKRGYGEFINMWEFKSSTAQSNPQNSPWTWNINILLFILKCPALKL